MKKNKFFKQSFVLISRYLKIFFNDRQNLILTMAIPILTIIVVCLVASKDMFAVKCDDNNINDGYPILSWEEVDYNLNEDKEEETEDEENEEREVKKWDGTVPQQPQLMPASSDNSKYYISSPGDLQFIANVKGEWLKKTYYLNNDMDMDGKEIIPIGTEDEPFTGTFEGNGHIIRNFQIKPSSKCTGLFGCLSGEDASIKNLGIEDGKIKSDSGEKRSFVGIIAGKMKESTVEKCYCKNCEISIKGEYIGSVSGYCSNSSVMNCYSRTNITANGSYYGGIVGKAENSVIKYTYYAGALSEAESSDVSCIGCILGSMECSDEDVIFNVYDKEINEETYKAFGNDGDGLDEDEYDNVGWDTDYLKENASLIRSLNKDVEDDEFEEDHNGDFKNDGELADFGKTQTGLFMLSCVAIFVGICNSVQEICKERNILKREYMTNLKLSSYITSKLVVQGLICAVQTVLILLIFFLSVHDKVFPEKGVLIPSAKIEIWITMFFLTYAADAIALLISSLVKNSATANTFIPIILIVQIVFSGVLFELGGFMKRAANLMISKWGIGALAATCHLNETRMSMLLKNPSMSISLGDSLNKINDLYVSKLSNLLSIWGILIAFVAVCATLSGVILTRVKKDRR